VGFGCVNNHLFTWVCRNTCSRDLTGPGTVGQSPLHSLTLSVGNRLVTTITKDDPLQRPRLDCSTRANSPKIRRDGCQTYFCSHSWGHRVSFAGRVPCGSHNAAGSRRRRWRRLGPVVDPAHASVRGCGRCVFGSMVGPQTPRLTPSQATDRAAKSLTGEREGTLVAAQ
jgi:hypothetical protein